MGAGGGALSSTPAGRITANALACNPTSPEEAAQGPSASPHGPAGYPHSSGQGVTGSGVQSCGPIIFSIQSMLYQFPNLKPQLWKVPTSAYPIFAWKVTLAFDR